MDNQSDPHIFQLIRQGDADAFSRLFDQYYALLCYFAARYLKDTDQARSLVQQLFVDLWMKREKIKITASVKSYLFHSVKNRCIDYLRKEKTTAELTSSITDLNETPFHDLVEEAELNELVINSINKLPEKCREIFILCKYEGLKYAEIASKLNISIKTVEMQMGIALKKLRNYLSDYQSFILFMLTFL